MELSLGQIADLVNGELVGNTDRSVTGAGPLELANEDQITFAEKNGLKRVHQTRANAMIVPRDFHCEGKDLIRVDNPRLAFAHVLTQFHPRPRLQPKIHASAIVGENCHIGRQVHIAAGVVVGNHVSLGDRVVLYPNVVVGEHTHIDDDTILYPQVTVLECCCIGKRVIVHAGTVIGSDGFGFVPDQGCSVKIPQTGIVQIDDDVEIGANNTIDRATFGKTWIKTGVKTDNLVHIAHNVTVGEHTVIVAQAGIAGSTTVGNHVIIAGQAGIGGHLTVGDGAIIGPRGAIAQSVKKGHIVSSTTLGMPHRTWLRLQKILPNLPNLQKQVKRLQEQLKKLQKEHTDGNIDGDP